MSHFTAKDVLQQNADGIARHTKDWDRAQASLFAPFAKAILDAHKVAHNLPAPHKQIQDEANRRFQAELDRQMQSASTDLIAYYNRPNGYSGD